MEGGWAVIFLPVGKGAGLSYFYQCGRGLGCNISTSVEGGWAVIFLPVWNGAGLSYFYQCGRGLGCHISTRVEGGWAVIFLPVWKGWAVIFSAILAIRAFTLSTHSKERGGKLVHIRKNENEGTNAELSTLHKDFPYYTIYVQ